MKKIRIGVMGCANIAQRMVIPAIKNLPDNFELVAIASRTYKKAQQFAHDFNTSAIIGYENLIDRDDIDAIYMPLPTGLHNEWISKALISGKHVLVEKSLALDYNSTQRLVELARSKNLLLMENFMFKYHHQHQVVWQNINKGNIGSVKLFRSQFGFPPLNPTNFRYDNDLGGGSLLDAGAYTVMASRWFLGDHQDVISSVLYIDSQRNIDINGSVTLKNRKGIVSQLSFGFDNYYQCNYEFWGSKGRLFVDKAFTPKPFETTQILLENQDKKVITNIIPDNHFLKILIEFQQCIEKKEHESKFQDILDQSKTLTEIKERSKKIQL